MFTHTRANHFLLEYDTPRAGDFAPLRFVPTGKVRIKKGSKVLKTVTLSKGKATVTLPKLKKGKHKLVVRYLGNGVAKASTSAKVTLTVKK